MQDFYVSLPSNTIVDDKYSRKNITSQFRVILPEEICLAGDEWEVALVEIQYPMSWNNISDEFVDSYEADLTHSIRRQNEIEILTREPGVQVCAQIAPGHYADAEALEAGLFDALQNATILTSRDQYAITKFFWFSWFKLRNKFVFKTTQLAGRKIEEVRLSPMLQYVLGFPSNRLFVGEEAEINSVEAKYAPDLRAGIDSLFIYCDIIEPQIVGNRREQVLRIIPATGVHGSIEDKVFIAPHYVPVLNKRFSSIEISIKTDQNKPVPFESGKSVVKLHFRKSRRFAI